MDTFGGVGGTLLAGLFILILCICWIVLPFAIIGTKPLLRELLAEQRRTNALLAAAAETRATIDPKAAAARQAISARDLATVAERRAETMRAARAFAIALTVMVCVGLAIWYFARPQ